LQGIEEGQSPRPHNKDGERFEYPRGSSEENGGKVAATARRELEKQLGQSVITRQNAKALSSPDTPKEIEDQ
jgi:hypothetical protein